MSFIPQNLTERSWVSWSHIKTLSSGFTDKKLQILNTFLLCLYGEEESNQNNDNGKKRGRGGKSKAVTSNMPETDFQKFLRGVFNQLSIDDNDETLSEIAECVWAGEQLHKVLSIAGRQGNRFQPSQSQLKKLHELFGDYWNRLDHLKRHAFLTKEQLYQEGEEHIYKDQIIRAQVLLDDIQDNKLTGILLMDGHGHMNWCLQEVALQKDFDMDKLNVQVIDLDNVVNDWHKAFLPRKTACATNNIFFPRFVIFKISKFTNTISLFLYFQYHRKDLSSGLFG